MIPVPKESGEGFDIQTHLPVKAAEGRICFEKGPIEYPQDPSEPSRIGLVVSGRFGTFRITTEGIQVGLDILEKGDIFSFETPAGRDCSRVTCLEPGEVCTWKRRVFWELLGHDPVLAVGFAQLQARRQADLERRLVRLASCKIPARIALFLSDRAGRSGNPAGGEAILLPPFTHELIARFVATDREIVTAQLNIMRREGLLGYSRRGIVLHDPDGLSEWARDKSSRRMAKA